MGNRTRPNPEGRRPVARKAPAKRAALGAHVTTEEEWQRQVVELAGILGWRHMHVRRTVGRGGRWTTSTSLKGFPDLLLWHEGQQRVVAAELKRERGVLSREQVEVLKSLKAAGMEVYVWKPSDLNEVKRLLSWPRAA